MTTLVATASLIGFSAGTASAADPSETFPNPTFPNDAPFVTDAHYNVTGAAHIKNKSTTVDVPISSTRITADVGTPSSGPDQGNVFDYFAALPLPLPPQQVFTKAFGYLPVRAKVSFTRVGPAVGSIDFAKSSITGNAKYVVSLSDVIVGHTKANVGPNCQTRYPVDVNFASDHFDFFGGGDPGSRGQEEVTRTTSDAGRSHDRPASCCSLGTFAICAPSPDPPITSSWWGPVSAGSPRRCTWPVPDAASPSSSARPCPAAAAG